MTIGPLSLAALQQLIRQHMGIRRARPAMVRIAEVSGGNPFFAWSSLGRSPQTLLT